MHHLLLELPRQMRPDVTEKKSAHADLVRFWLGRANNSVNNGYGKLKDGVAFRKTALLPLLHRTATTVKTCEACRLSRLTGSCSSRACRRIWGIKPSKDSDTTWERMHLSCELADSESPQELFVNTLGQIGLRVRRHIGNRLVHFFVYRRRQKRVDVTLMRPAHHDGHA